MKRICITLFISLLLLNDLQSQTSLPDSCKLQIGTNLGGLSDYGTELPFVDLMHNCRTWFTKDLGNPNDPWDSGNAALLSYRSDGYPTEIPQNIEGTDYAQLVETIWAITDGWPSGTYTVFYDGTGEIEFDFVNSTQINSNKITFELPNPIGSQVAMIIKSSLASDPIRNIRVIMPGYENTYLEQPFYPLWLEKLSIFKSVRFMDWGATNNWGQKDPWSWEDTTTYNWNERAKMENYTWANSKGIPYEMMIKLMNEFNIDGWVCVPHRARNNYIQEMAKLFRDNINTERKLFVEYSNETWNWMFGQCQWLNKYGCENNNISWPEGIVPYIQNVMDIWTEVYGSEIGRIERVVGVQTAWQDVSNRIVFNLRNGSFDSFATTSYFGLPEEGDAALDSLGAEATVADVAKWARFGEEKYGKPWLREQKSTIGDSLNIPMRFYEGGQHLTPTPFGDEPTYANSLLDIQRDTSMYNLYMQWFDFLKTLQTGNEPLQIMNYSFVSGRSARYGSWGILESLDQDTSIIPAPKYKAIKETIDKSCNSIVSVNDNIKEIKAFTLEQNYPNPFNPLTTIKFVLQKDSHVKLELFNILGEKIATLVDKEMEAGSHNYQLSISNYKLPSGVYIYKLQSGEFLQTRKLMLIK